MSDEVPKDPSDVSYREICTNFTEYSKNFGSNLGDNGVGNGDFWRLLSVFTAVVSMLSLFVIILTIKNNFKLKAHPSKLILLICTVEAIFCWISLV